MPETIYDFNNKASTVSFSTKIKPKYGSIMCTRLLWIHSSFMTYLIIDKQLDGVVSPLYQHDLIGLSRDTVRKGGSDSRTGAGLEPHTHGEGVHLWQTLLYAAIQVVGAQGQRHLKVLW